MDLAKNISLLKKGDQQACREVYNGFANQFMAISRRYLGNTPEAQDMLTNAFVKIFKNVKKAEFDNEKAFVGWMKRILINECLMELRRKSNFQMMPENEADFVSIEANIIQDLAAKEIMEVINEMPTGYRTVFNLYVIEGYSHAEIAEQLKISEGTSKSQLSHAKKYLRTKLQNIYGKEAGSRS
ncbi:RNA polymerase sigma factor [Jiulongibacter sp. NS-SX5]|uniref:RNA polymerase sigma factor n=1 Tax=Jiulongibacter sp. NS-SX5 TaxID=3463854 RepID=UPI0040584564